MPSPIPIQLALQGGGAKICYLLAFLEGVSRVETVADGQPSIRVTRIAGTSAGSLAGAFYASRKVIWEIKKDFRNLADIVVAKYPRPRPWELLWKVLWRKQPIWDETHIEQFLLKLFDSTQRLSDFRHGDRGMDLLIVSSNLNTCDENLCSGSQATVASIMDSCGLPFLFRVCSETVDGGICSNLPVLQLNDGQHNDAPIVAVNFLQPQRTAPKGIIDFILRLFDAGINNTTKLHAAGADFVFTFDETGVDTIDFRKAKDYLDTNEYRALADKAEEWFRGTVIPKTPASLRGKSQLNELKSMLDAASSSVFHIYQHHLKGLKRVDFIHYHVIAHSLKQSCPAPDETILRMRFRAEAESIRALAFHVQKPFEGVQWKMTDSNGQEVDISVHPAKYDDDYCTCVIIPLKPILPDPSSHYELCIRESCDALKPLRELSHDELFYEPESFLESIPEITIAIIYPRDCDITSKQHAESKAQESFEIFGNQINSELLSAVPAGYKIQAWKGTHVTKGGYGVQLTHVPPR